jgi:transcriptional regulator GlxA family with amidase domain
MIDRTSNPAVHDQSHTPWSSRVFHDAIAFDAPAKIPLPVPVRGGLAQWQVRRAKQIMSAHLEGKIAIGEVAEACRLSQSHFTRAFKATTGRPPHRWLLEYRVERAKHLLTESDHRLADIALSCGFADQSHFVRVFSQIIGITPGAWRRAFKDPA